LLEPLSGFYPYGTGAASGAEAFTVFTKDL
jgi:hypothetical protein